MVFSTTCRELKGHHSHSHNKKKTQQTENQLFLDPLAVGVTAQMDAFQIGEWHRQIQEMTVYQEQKFPWKPVQGMKS